MKRNFFMIAIVIMAVLLMGVSLTAAADARTVVIGFTASQTGKYNVELTRQVNGLNLWINQVNDAGGITLSDGTVITFDTVSYDDESATDRVQELYTRLATDDNADFLISPYSSGLTDASAVIAEQYNKIMITTGAASDSTYQKGYTLVFQTYHAREPLLDRRARSAQLARRLSEEYRHRSRERQILDRRFQRAERLCASTGL